MSENDPLDRWRLVLGRYARARLGPPTSGEAGRREAALDYLYGRSYAGRGVRETPGQREGEKGPGTLDPSQLTLVTWLAEVRELFPQRVAEVVEGHALDRFGLTELVTDPQTLERLTPNQDLLRVLLTVRGSLTGDVVHLARRVVTEVVEDIRRRLEPQVRRALSGRLNRTRHSPMPSQANVDLPGTIRTNLKHWDAERRQLVVERVLFFERNDRRLPWDVILCVDQSGSMADSVIHSAVMAGILAGLPSLRVRLVVFDTSVVDLTEHVDDPVEVLMSVQLGGGTDIGRAVAYCRTLVETPSRTVFVLVSDFYEGGSPRVLLDLVSRMAADRVRMLGLAALDGQSNPDFDRHLATELAERGMNVAALTPQALAEWLVGVIS